MARRRRRGEGWTMRTNRVCTTDHDLCTCFPRKPTRKGGCSCVSVKTWIKVDQPPAQDI